MTLLEKASYAEFEKWKHRKGMPTDWEPAKRVEDIASEILQTQCPDLIGGGNLCEGWKTQEFNGDCLKCWLREAQHDKVMPVREMEDVAYGKV